MDKREVPNATWPELVGQIPPGRLVKLQDGVRSSDNRECVATVEVVLWCGAETCNSPMLFECVEEYDTYLSRKKIDKDFIAYRCKHCEQTMKHFAFIFWFDEPDWMAIKLGEWPTFGPHVPARVLRLVQEDVEFFLQGRRAESLGLGIGAFAYYRRVVENQKSKLFDRIIAAARKVGMKPAEVAALEQAKGNFQFSQSVDDFKALLPQGLLINGQNPLLLLHTALSNGIHSQADDECLELAQAIRVVLTELADRISQILKDNAEINDAVTCLIQKRTTDSKQPTAAGGDASTSSA